MCWGVLGKLVEISGVEGEVDIGGARVRALVATEDVKPGDVVLVHAGVVLEKLDREDVMANLAVYYDLMKYHYVFNGMPEGEAEKKAAEDLTRLARELGVDPGELAGALSEGQGAVYPQSTYPEGVPPNAFHMEYAVQLAETDYLQVMHYTNYMRVCERAFMEMLSSAGIGYSKLIHEYGIFIPTVEVKAEVKSPCRLDNKLKVYVWIEEVGKKHLRYRCLVYNTATNRLAADVSHVAVCTDTAISSSHEIPAEVREVLEKLVAQRPLPQNKQAQNKQDVSQ